MQTDVLAANQGKWGERTESGEEMWWSGVNPKLAAGKTYARFRFFIDARQHFLIRFLTRARKALGGSEFRVLDFGCGTGGTTLNLASYLRQPITGYDVYATQVEIARKLSEKIGGGCEFKLMEKGKIPEPDASFDALMNIDVLGHVPSIPETLREWNRVLKLGGSIAMYCESTFSERDTSILRRMGRKGLNLDHYFLPEHHISLKPREELEKHFAEAGFEVVERYSASLWHFLFFSRTYTKILESNGVKSGWLYWASVALDKAMKISPFYPMPLHLLRLAATYVLGPKDYGTFYFYHLKKTR